MAKETRIEVSCVFDGEEDATDVFVSLIAEKYKRAKQFTAEPEDLCYDGSDVPDSHCPSGLRA